MNPVDAIVMALTPGSLFNQSGKVFRSTKALAQFAGVEQGEVLDLIANNIADQVTIRPSAKRPENGPLVALTQHLADQEQPGGPQVHIVAGNAVGAEADAPAQGQTIPDPNADIDAFLDEPEAPEDE